MLSIIVPVFNELNYLKKFTTRLEEAYINEQDVEYIYINDGSTDGSKEWLQKYIEEKENSETINKYKILEIDKNKGKGFAVRKGIENSKGNYLLFHDSDLELDPMDSKEMYEIIKKNKEMEVLFGSRFSSGKLRSNKYFLNTLIVKINTFLFNILFQQSLTDLHCGMKIVSRRAIEKLNLKVNDFGFEIDISSQIAKNNIKIYEYGVSYFARTIDEGKKITWFDGLLSYFYLFKLRYLDNDISILKSILYSSFYMAFIASYFSMGIGKIILVIVLLILGSFIGLKYKLFPSSLIFLTIFVSSFFSKGNGKYLATFIGVVLGYLIANFVSKKINKITNNKIINFFV
mgnify:CR=1 FL=1